MMCTYLGPSRSKQCLENIVGTISLQPARALTTASSAPVSYPVSYRLGQDTTPNFVSFVLCLQPSNAHAYLPCLVTSDCIDCVHLSTFPHQTQRSQVIPGTVYYNSSVVHEALLKQLTQRECIPPQYNGRM